MVLHVVEIGQRIFSEKKLFKARDIQPTHIITSVFFLEGNKAKKKERCYSG